ncbi:MAG: AraC family transcriptional regulator [Colwellia sp.]
MRKKERCRHKIVALTQKYAQNQPEFSQIENQDAFMVKAAFPTYEGSTISDNYFKLGLILQGEGFLSVNTTNGSITSKFRQGLMSATMPGQSGDAYSSPMNMLGICIDLDKFDNTAIGGIEKSALEKASQSLFEDSMIQSVMVALWQTSRGTDYSSLFFREGVELILNRIGRKSIKRESRTYSDKTNKARLQRVHRFIYENLTKNICVADMALEAGLGEVQFFNICRQVTGMTPFTYLTHCRLQQAKYILGEGSSVTEASLEVGYTNPSKFSAAFRRHIGQTPSQWRKLNVL